MGKSTPRLLTSVIYECERRTLRQQLSVDDTYRCDYTKKFSEAQAAAKAAAAAASAAPAAPKPSK